MDSSAWPEKIEVFAGQVRAAMRQNATEGDLTKVVAARLRELLAEGLELPESLTRANPDHYVMYPLHVEPDGSFSIASAVWGVGQVTPVHGHETWGVVGIHSGVERETAYVKPHEGDTSMTALDTVEWPINSVTVCCTTDDDVHAVECGSDVPCVGIHVYGADIGTLQRRKYDPETAAAEWFVSTWATAADA